MRPVSLLLHNVWRFMRQTVRSFRANQGLLLAGAVAYYALLSIVPLLILTVIALSHFIDQGNPLLSGYKSNKLNWLAVSGISVWDVSACKAHETSVFSKTDTDKICRHV